SRTGSDIVSLDATERAWAIRSRAVSCREVMQAFLAQIDRHNPAHNAIVSLQDRDGLLQQAGERDRQLARGEYLGWMHGFPQAPKDLTSTAGITTTLGSPIYRNNVPAVDSIMVERIRRNGAILIGKTNTPEFGLGSHTYNNVFGTTLNAYDTTRTAGGSSGGAAVALALRMLPVADGSDMMGSLRNPAAYNNVFGFRPSYGRVPGGLGTEIFYPQLATEGPMARTVTDLALLLAVQAGFDDRLPLSIDQDPSMFARTLDRDFRGTRLAWLGDMGGYLPFEPGVLALCRGALKDLEAIGCIVEEARPDFPCERMWSSWLTLRALFNSGRNRPLYANPETRAQMKPEAVWEVESGMTLSADAIYQASVDRSGWYMALRALFQRYDYLLLPSAQVFPFDATLHWPDEIAGRRMDTYHRWMEVVVPASLAGLPTISVPAGFDPAGLPMGMQIIGKAQADLAVLQLAYAYEQATQWVQKRPPPSLA
ncbi:MAG: amidase, partial [Vicinamibacterales bacterium]|nr:amidase [Vicinamibacterales bacterium]